MLRLLAREQLGWALLAWAFCATLGVLLLREAGWRWDESMVMAGPLMGFHLVTCSSAWFISGFTPLRRGPSWRVVASTLVAAILAGGLWVQQAYLWAAVLAQTSAIGDLGSRLAAVSSSLWAGGMLLYLCAGAVAFLHAEREDAQAAREAALRGETLAREAELMTLRAQISPHFLFNSLHSISALAGVDKDRAREMCALLSDFLRRSIGIGDRRMIPLSEELALVRQYLKIEQVRYQRFVFEEQVEGSAVAVSVPPLVLQPLVENAIRHGVATLTEGGRIALEARSAGNHVHIRLVNNYDPEAPARKGAGVGLENVRRRLRNLYGGGARLDTFREAGQFRAEIYLLKQVPEVV